MSNLVSVVIPSRSPQYLKRTVEDLLEHATGDVEIIVVFDGVWLEPMPEWDKRVRIVHQGTPHNNLGMRAAINAGVAISRGKFIAKSDEHCSFSQGWDRILAEDCGDNDMVIPRRGRLDVDTWTKIEDGRADIDFMAIDYPYAKLYDKTQGLHGSIWKRPGREHILYDETPTSQGSFWWMTRKHWDRVIKEMDEANLGPFTGEAQELGCKTWLSGGKVMVNKKVTYLHFYKGSKGKNYGFTTAQYKKHQEAMERGRLFCIDYFTQDRWPERKHDWEWFINKFPDMPGWEGDWKSRLERDRKLEEEFRTKET